MGSPSFGQWTGISLSAENKRQLWVPPGFAHGFCVTSESALFTYKCTELYHPNTEGCVLWNDPDIGVEWPVSKPVLSDKDAKAARLRELPEAKLPHVEARLPHVL